MTNLILTGAGFFVVGFIAMIIGWKVHPWTVGAMTQWVESPMQQFSARMATTTVWTVIAIWIMNGLFPTFYPDAMAALKSSPAISAVQESTHEGENIPVAVTEIVPELVESEPDPFIEPVQEVVTATSSTPTRTTQTERNNPIVRPVVEEIRESKPEQTTTKREETVEVPSVAMKVAELKGELAVVDTKIESERTRWQGGIDTINRLTNFKRTPVREGSQQYHQCMEASRIIKEVESGAAALKAEKARLSVMIESLEN